MKNSDAVSSITRANLDNALIILKLKNILNAREIVNNANGYAEDLEEHFQVLERAYIDCIKQESLKLVDSFKDRAEGAK